MNWLDIAGLVRGCCEELIISRSTLTYSVCFFCLVVIVVLLGYHFIDTRLAYLIAGIMGPHFLFAEDMSHIPDLLLWMVIAITVLSWGCRFYILRKKSNLVSSDFLEIIGYSVPLAYLSKLLCKFVFGRPNTRVWLTKPGIYGMHWFNGGGEFSGFPSGHMAVFTVMTLAIARYYPQFRYLCWGFLVLLGVALLATEYHFFSDLVAGVYMGWIVDRLTQKAVSRYHRAG